MQKICYNLLDNEYQLQYYFDKILIVFMPLGRQRLRSFLSPKCVSQMNQMFLILFRIKSFHFHVLLAVIHVRGRAIDCA